MSYFLKVPFVQSEHGYRLIRTLQCATENQGKLMIEGEFASLSEIVKYNSSLAPKPCAHGQFKDPQIPSESRCIS